MSSLGSVFDSAKKIELLYDDVKNSGILDPVGTSAFSVQDLQVSANNASLKVFDLNATFGANASANAQIQAQTAQLTAYDDDPDLAAPAGSSYATLTIKGSLNAGVASPSSLPFSLSASGASTFEYDHYLLAAATDKRLDALTKVVSSARLPQFASLAAIDSGEVLRFQAALNVDFGIQAKYGKSFDLSKTLELFKGLSAQLQAQVQYQLEASLGWSLYDYMLLVVGKAQQQNPGWARIRVSRANGNTLTAGATFSLQVDYDASSIGNVLEKVFDMTPLPRAIAILRTVSAGNWDQIKGTITDRAANDLVTAIAGTGWKQKAANDPAITKALAAINKVVSIYNGVDAKVAQLWSDLLAKVDLQPGSPVRSAIDKIAALDPQKLDLQQFLGAGGQKDIDLLESLTGESFENLIVGTNATVQLAATKAVNLAKQLQTIINDTPAEIDSALDQFATDHGIKSAIEWLAANATSLDQIQSLGDQAITNLVSKAVGKLFSSISASDLQAVQSWATKILASWDDLTSKLSAAAAYLKGTLGFNASLEFSRVSEQSAVLDFEVDPSNSAAVKAVQDQLPAGNVRDMLAALDAISADGSGNLPYLIRESVLVSRRLRTGVTTVLLSLLGLSKLQKVTGTRFEESVTNVGMNGRTANYSGGFSQAITAGTASSECSVWVAADASDSAKDPSKPFAAVARSMHLTFARTDTSTNAEELGALQTLLVDLGFFATAGATLTAPDGAQTTFTMNIVLDEAAIAAFAKDDGEDNWNKDYRNAAYRLLNDNMITDTIASIGVQVGEVLAVVVKSQQFADTWVDTSLVEFKQRISTDGIAVNGKNLQILDMNNNVIPPYVPIQMVIRRRPNGFNKLASLRNGLTGSASGQPSALDGLIAGAAATFSNTTLPEWDNPMFNFWFVVARLCRLGAQVLSTANGLATFRYKTSSDAALSAPLQWTLTQDVGVPADQIQSRSLFPFV